MVPERLADPGYPSLWPSWHDFSARKPCSPCKSMRQVFPLKASNFAIFRSVFRPTIFVPCSPVFFSFRPPVAWDDVGVRRTASYTGNYQTRELSAPIPTRDKSRVRANRDEIRMYPGAGDAFVSRISRYDEYFFRSNYFLISKVIIIFVRLEMSVVITDRDLNFLEMYHKILPKLFSQLCVG